MEHLLIRAGRLRILVADPEASVHGKPVGFGNLVRHTQEAFEAAHGLDARLCLLRSGRPLNAAVTSLASPDVDTVPGSGWQHAVLAVIWRAARPARAGGWKAWAGALVAGAVRRRARQVIEARARLGARGAGLVKRADRTDKWARALAQRSIKTADDLWRARFREAGQQSRVRLRAQKLDGVRVVLPEDLFARARAQAETAGIRLDAPMVTLHVREHGYGRYDEAHSRPIDAWRNAPIATYEDAVRGLAAAGYTVVRVGDASMTRVDWDGMVDLATAAWRTDLLELWCVLRSRFFIASDSGPYFLTRLANLPCLAVNVLQVGYYIARDRDRFICKPARHRASGRTLSVEEMLSDEYLTHGLEPGRYEQVENSAADIAEAVADMAALVEQGEPRSPAQTAYDRRVAELAVHWKKSSGHAALVVRRNALGTISRRFAGRHYFAAAEPAAAADAYGHHTTH